LGFFVGVFKQNYKFQDFLFGLVTFLVGGTSFLAVGVACMYLRFLILVK
jgi:hypothetical protein